MSNPDRPKHNSRSRKLLWFIALWAGGVLTVTVMGYGIRLVLGP